MVPGSAGPPSLANPHLLIPQTVLALRGSDGLSRDPWSVSGVCSRSSRAISCCKNRDLSETSVKDLTLPRGKNLPTFFVRALRLLPFELSFNMSALGLPPPGSVACMLVLDVTSMPGLESSCHSSSLRTSRLETAGRSQFNDKLAGRPTPRAGKLAPGWPPGCLIRPCGRPASRRPTH